MEPILLNVMEVYAPNQEAAQEARRGWIARSTTLDIMYNTINGLQAASLDAKNYIYSKLLPIIDAALIREEENTRKSIEDYLEKIRADYYRPTATQPAFIVFFDYSSTPDYYRRQKQQLKMLKAFTARHNLRTDANHDNSTAYFYIYA